MLSGVRHCAMFVGSGLPLCLLLWLAASRFVFRGVFSSFQLCIHIPSPRIPLYAFVYIYISEYISMFGQAHAPHASDVCVDCMAGMQAQDINAISSQLF